MFTNFILCRIDAKIYLLYYEDPEIFIVSVYMYFISPIFILFLSILNIRRMSKLTFWTDAEMKKLASYYDTDKMKKQNDTDK